MTDVLREKSRNSNNTSDAHQSSPKVGNQNAKNNGANGRQIKRYYIDELGFYRHLDPDQNQYVCSNLNATNLRYQAAEEEQQQQNDGLTGSIGDRGYDISFRAIRTELGISHFDKTLDYASWKRNWDNFMRAKLTRPETVILNRDLKMRIRSGIPHDYRCKVWSALIRMRTKFLREQTGEDIYQVILADCLSKISVPDYSADPSGALDDLNNNRIKCNSSYRSPLLIDTHDGIEIRRLPPLNLKLLDKCFRQIELDLLRTLPNNRHFEGPNSLGIQRVRRVLRAYACFNQTVGYCQGMNRLAAMALLVLPEEEAFWCLVAIVQCIMPKDYYLRPWLAQVDCHVLNDLLKSKLPELHKHLVNNDIQLTLFTWFFTIFVDGFRPELMLRIWDCFLVEGDKVLFRFALAILQISQNELLEMNDFSTMSAHLSRLVSTRKLDMEQLFESKCSLTAHLTTFCAKTNFQLQPAAFVATNPLPSGFLRARRDFHRNRMQPFIED